ncbi:putative inactive receptor kinase [Apostasia shenzhenica]|uniref:Putative inactive receptor kinase n=1 Tax=Apostasia shenzhenica TaxID=1088818 RepID=A0A2I0B0Y4_9ASPA|nr:putative inactive receptor kinase [Apostasia shenzhenica]
MGSPLLVVLLLFLHSFSMAAADLAADGAALMAFRSAVGQGVLSWNTSASPCSWKGVTCKGGRVTSLRLPGSSLIGQIPAGTLANLSDLRTLSLRSNALDGLLPSDLARSSQLRNLYLQGNRFSGDIPAFLPELRALTRLSLADNNFSGEIPQSLNNLTHLTTLYLQNNRLTGGIMDLNIPNLRQFNVSYNRLNGSVPAKLQRMPANSFLGTQLCGRPLSPCPSEAPPSPAPDSSSSSNLSGGAIAGIAIGAVAAFLILAVVLFLTCRRKREPGSRRISEVPAAKPTDGIGSHPSPAVAPATAGTMKQLMFIGSAPRVYDLEDLLRASAEVLGKGTFGTAYKVGLEAGLVLVVKRLKDVNLQENEFREKIAAISAIDHPNVVPLRAYYYSREEKLLVYDYIRGGSLHSLLHGSRSSSRAALTLESRISIALSAASAIAFMHSTSPNFSHGNIKSSNILVSSSSESLVSDAAVAHLAGGASYASTAPAGYCAPEVTDVRRVSQKADVYSFGVVLLELLTARSPAQGNLDDGGVDLPRWVKALSREEHVGELFDPELLKNETVGNEITKLLKLGIVCTADHPDQRPAMIEVVAKIAEIRRLTVSHTKD